MYVKDTLPDNTREKGRSSTGASDTHRNTQHHKNYLDKQLLIEKEKELELERERVRERDGDDEGYLRDLQEEEEEEVEGEYRAGENSNESEVGSAIQFSTSVNSIFSESTSGK